MTLEGDEPLQRCVDASLVTGIFIISFHQFASFIYYNLNQFFIQIFLYFCFYLVFLPL